MGRVENGGSFMATAPDGLPTALHITPHVLPGNKIEITTPEFQIGADVDGFAVPRLSETRPRLRA
jgi:hypothetical protein